MHRTGDVSADATAARLAAVAAAPIARRVDDLIEGARARRDQLRLADAIYVELADRHDVRLITTDERLARTTPIAEVATT